MRIISERALREYWTKHADAESPMRTWIKTVQPADWSKFADVKETFGNADYHQDFVIFNVGGNNFRIVAIVEYKKHIVFISAVLSHAEYDVHQNWCDCGRKGKKR